MGKAIKDGTQSPFWNTEITLCSGRLHLEEPGNAKQALRLSCDARPFCRHKDSAAPVLPRRHTESVPTCAASPGLLDHTRCAIWRCQRLFWVETPALMPPSGNDLWMPSGAPSSVSGLVVWTVRQMSRWAELTQKHQE